MKHRLNGTRRSGRRADRARDELRASVYAQLASVLDISGYENASPDRLRHGSLSVRGGSADSHRDTLTRDNLRRQCQQLDRNNVLARGLVQRLIDMVVGDGFVLEARTEDDDWNAEAEKLFNEWAENCDGPGVDLRGKHSIDDFAAENVRAACFEGDLLYIKTDLGSLQAVEAERIRNPGASPLDSVLPGGNMMVGGVEMDGAGRAIAYHVSSWSGVAGGSFAASQTQSVRADACLFLVNPLRDITGATRGEPQLQAALSRFEHLEGFDESARTAARIHAILSAFIVLQNPEMDILGTQGTVETESNADGEGQDVKHEELESGMYPRRLRPGESIETVQSTQPGPEYERFTLVQILYICSNLGLPLPLALLDGRQVNLSSIRSVLQFAWRNFERWQSWLIRKFYREVYRWRIAMFIREGRLPFREDWAGHDWMARTPPVMDPKVEVEAARARIDAGLASPSRVMREVYGIDSASEWAQCQKDKAEMAVRGVEMAAAPGSKGVVEPPAPEPPDYDGDESDSGKNEGA